jgi:hypothetical protein
MSLGADERQVTKLAWLGISGICNLLAAIKTAKYFELGEQDVIFTVFTDSTDLYQSRLEELRKERGAYRAKDAVADCAGPMAHQGVDYFKGLTYPERKAIHNLKYYTWVEQQGKTYQEIQSQWYDETYWSGIHRQLDEIDSLIEQFNSMTGLMK